MKKIKIYHYPQCSTCKKALALLDINKVNYEAINIVEQPPTMQELMIMLENMDNSIQKLFNTSGQLYREMNIKELLPSLSTEQALTLLSQHGKLIKRPFILNGLSGTVGFNETKIRNIILLAKD